MFFKDVRKLFFRDVKDDQKSFAPADSERIDNGHRPSPPVNAPTEDRVAAGRSNPPRDVPSRPDHRQMQSTVSRKDANGHATQFTFEGLPTPNRITFADGSSFCFHYSENGALQKFFTGDKALASYHGDQSNGNKRVDYSDGTSAEFKFKDGRLISASNSSGTVELKYDAKGYVNSESFQGRTVTYHRNKAGHLIGFTTPFGQIIHFKRDAENRVCHIKDWTGQGIDVHYAPNGVMKNVIYPNGTQLNQRSTTSGLPAGLRLTMPQTGERLLHKNYERDPFSRITRVTGRDHEIAYRYDEQGRLCDTESNTSDDMNEAFNVDAKANRLSDLHCRYRINEADRIVQAGKSEFQYDGLGNVILGTCPKGPARFTYANLNCLRSISTDIGLAQYSYDALGRRVAKKVNGVTTRYYWAGNQMLNEVRRSTGKGSPIEVTDYLFFPGSPALLAIRKDRTTHWAAFGHRYEVLCLTSDKGQVVWRAEYDSHGNAYIDKGEAIFQPFRLAGHYQDMESGLHYTLNRYYDPELGRYLSMTPRFLDSGCENFYVYGNGDPINHIHMNGKMTFSPVLISASVDPCLNNHVEAGQCTPKNGSMHDGFTIARSALIGGAFRVAVNGAPPKDMADADAGAVHADAVETISSAVPRPPQEAVVPANQGRDASGKEAEDAHTQEGMRAEKPATTPKPRAATAPEPERTRTKPAPVAKTVHKKAPGRAKSKSRRPDHFPHTYLVGGFIDALSGEVILRRTDFALKGRIPLAWTCTYRSRDNSAGLLGKGWRCPADAHLDIDNPWGILFYDGGTTEALFDSLPANAPIMEPMYGAWLSASQEHYQVRLKSGLTYHFLRNRNQTRFHVVRISDAADNFISFNREVNELATIRDSSGQYMIVQCERGRIVRMVLESTNLIEYHYKDGHLAAAADALGHSKRYFYGGDALISHSDSNDYALYYQYDEAGRCTGTWDDSGLYEYRLEYRPDDHYVRVTDSIGHKRTFAYDRYQQTFTEEDHSGATTTHDYDEMGRIIAITDPLDRCTAYEYDGVGNVTGIIQPDFSRHALTYDDRNRPVELIDADGRKKLQRFDKLGRLTEQVDIRGEGVRFGYNHQGDLVSISREGLTTTVQYDHHGLIAAVVDGKNDPILFKRDAQGNTTAIVDPAGRTIRYIYDGKNRLVQTLQPSGVSQSFDWDAEDNLLIHTDPNGRQTRFEYDGGSKIVRRVNADGTSISYQYDTESNLINVINERGESRHYQYDHNGRVISETDNFGHTSRYVYDVAGQLIRQVDPLGRTITYAYDAMGRLATRTHGEEIQTAYQWDADGKLISAQSPDIAFERRFDSAGRLAGEKKGSFGIEYRYNKKGRRTERVTSHGHQVGYRYDASGTLTAVQINGMPPITIERNDRGQIVEEKFSEFLHRSFSYDQDGLLIRQTISADTAEIERRYAYDGAGNLMVRQNSHNGNWRYTYDTMDRITEALDPAGHTYHWNYDACGNVLEHQPGKRQGLRCALYDDIQYNFDEAGNLVHLISGDSKYRLEWDDLHQLRTIVIGGVDTIAMTYDALGRRHTKTVNGKTTLFNWEDRSLISEEHADGSVREYIYYPGTRVPFAMIDERGLVYYYHNDINGLPQELTQMNGDIVWAADYNAQGKVKQILVDQLQQPLRLTGHYFDEESGLSYDGSRYFDPLTCAFISPNLQRPVDNENLYTYSPNVWTQTNAIGCCKAELKKRVIRKHYSEIMDTCVSTAASRSGLLHGHHMWQGRPDVSPQFCSTEWIMEPAGHHGIGLKS